MKAIATAARGHWREILGHFGLSIGSTNRHGPCPMCGGKDRFRFDDKEDRGTFYCTNCGGGDGFILLQKYKGVSAYEAVKMVGQLLGVAEDQSRKMAPDNSGPMRALWERGRAPVENGPVYQYLMRRVGRWQAPNSIRECMDVFDPETRQKYPAMLAKVAADNRAVNLHITYLTLDGRKAPTSKPKRVMKGSLPEGSAIRLMPAAPVMGIAEGIETALSASALFDMPVWAAVSGAGLAKWIPPVVSRDIKVFADNDTSYAGQAKAYALAQRLVTTYKKNVEVVIPPKIGSDWNDALNLMLTMEDIGQMM